MRDGSEQKLTAGQVEKAFIRIIEQHYRRDLEPQEKSAITEMIATYVVFDKLREQKRDSVWTYVARNLSRPLALAFGTGWANIVVGNPPCLAFRYMSDDLQRRFRELAKAERVIGPSPHLLRSIDLRHIRGKPLRVAREFRFAAADNEHWLVPLGSL